MKIKVSLPLSLHRFAGGKTEFECNGDSPTEIFKDLVGRFPQLTGQLLDEKEILKPSFSILVNGKIIRKADYRKIKLSEGDTFSILQLVAGG